MRDLTVPLAQYVRDLRRQASDAEWSGDTTTARNLEREADRAIEDGEDPVVMF